MKRNNKGSGNVTYLYIIVFISIILFGGLSFVLTEISNTNTQLSATSRQQLEDFNDRVQNDIPASSLETEQSDPNITSGSGEQDFSREFRESVALSTDAEPSITKIKNLPDLYVSAAGLQKNDQMQFYLRAIGFTLAFIIGLAFYIFWKTGEVKPR